MVARSMASTYKPVVYTVLNYSCESGHCAPDAEDVDWA